jgi:hypothetical protein
MMKTAQLVAESVCVLCPSCGATQPSRDGSEQWLLEDFRRMSKDEARRKCVGCDEVLLVRPLKSVAFA